MVVRGVGAEVALGEGGADPTLPVYRRLWRPWDRVAGQANVRFMHPPGGATKSLLPASLG